MKSSPSSECFLGSFLPRAAAGDHPGSAAFELDQDDLFASGVGSPKRPQPARPLLVSSIRVANHSPLPRFRRPPGGILEALPERLGPLSPRPYSLRPSSSSTSSSPASPVPALPRMIPAIPHPTPASVLHMLQSAPVNVPAAWLRRPLVEAVMCEADEDDDDEMLPPQEMVARSQARESPMTTFSVLGGAGCTLKGSDLRQIFDLFDVKRRGVVDFADFVRALNIFHPSIPMEEKIDFSFKLYDMDNTGFTE